MSGSLLLAAIAVWFAAGAVLSYFARSAAGAGRGMSGFFLANRGIGGVVSAITKSGGNDFSGSFRDSFTNPAWDKTSDYGEAQQDSWNQAYDLLSEEVPLYPLFHRNMITGYHADQLNNFVPIGTTGLNFIGVSTK